MAPKQENWEVTLSRDWAKYDIWNRAIAQSVFQKSVAGRPVYLNVDPDAFDILAREICINPEAKPDEELIEVVKETLSPPDSSEGTFGAHSQRAWNWSWEGGSEPPPCIALLTVFSLVAERMKQSEQFASSNYYDRLLQMLSINQSHRDAVVRDFGKLTPELWNTLNRWLEDSNGRYGLPTANAFDRRRYIGLPLSQALVRAQDRIKLPSLFGQCGLQPGQRISVRAMQELLEEWLPNSQVTPSLKRLWSKISNRERISEVACGELEGWDGTFASDTSPTGHVQQDNLFLAAESREFPYPEVELLLIARRSAQDSDWPVYLSSNKPGGIPSILEQVDEDICLEPIPGAEWASLEFSQAVSYSNLLIANLSLETKRNARAYTRRAKSLVLLQLHVADHLFIESRRAELLETYIILVVPRLFAAVRELLELNARQGFREFTHEQLRGLPPGWRAFTDVQLERIPSISNDDLRALKPIAKTHLALGDGLALPGMNVWHSARLPEIRIVTGQHDGSDQSSLKAIPLRYLDGTEPKDVQLSVVQGAGIISLSEHAAALREGDFRIVASSSPKNRTLATASIRIRSGSSPRRLETGEESQIGHCLLSNGFLNPFGRRPKELGHRSIQVHGACFQESADSPPFRPARDFPPVPHKPGTIIKSIEEHDLSPSYPDLEDPAEELPICLEREHHIWVCETRQGREPVYSACKDCGLEQWWEPPKRKRNLKKGFAGASPDDAAAITPHAPLRRIEENRHQPDLGLLLDALSYARCGPWRSFSGLATSLDDAPWFAREASRRLDALGHVEVAINERSVRPERWAIAPATVVVPEMGPAFLAGSRSARLIESVTQAADALEGEVVIVPQKDAPEVVELHNLSTDDLQLIVDDVAQIEGLSVGLSIHPATRIARLLPPLGTIREFLPELTITAPRFERLDLGSSRWLPTDRIDDEGAYRLLRKPLVYAVVPGREATDQRCVIADVRLAKYLAAKDASISLMGYDPWTSTLLTSMGAPLPSLFERAAVLCTGRLPTHRADDTLLYEGVPSSVAELIWQALYSND